MNRALIILLGACALSGCTTMSTVMAYEPTAHRVQMPDDTYRVFDHPQRDRIMTTPSVGKGASQSFVQGATLGRADARTPMQMHEAAARKYLNDTGRANCTITSGKLIVQPQYEFMIAC